MSEATKILYVEDEPSLGKIVQDSLLSRGFDVTLVKDGALVMTQCHKLNPDICVLDVMLPNVDGFTLGKEIKVAYPNMPIIYLTAKTQTSDLVTGFEAGGNDYIKKPFSMEELIIRIDNLLSLAQPTKKEIVKSISIGKFTFYPYKLELVRDEQVIQLSNRECELLLIFARHLNQTVQRKKILESIWGSDSVFHSRNLDVYITKLRQYFKPDPAIKLITLKGVGYCFYIDH